MLCGMKNFKLDEWRVEKTKGKQAFLLRYGFLGRGLPLGVLVAVLVEVGAYAGKLPDLLMHAPFWGRMAFAIAVFTATGCINATLNWNLHEKRHRSS